MPSKRAVPEEDVDVWLLDEGEVDMIVAYRAEKLHALKAEHIEAEADARHSLGLAAGWIEALDWVRGVVVESQRATPAYENTGRLAELIQEIDDKIREVRVV
jgi:hypothetical protein